MLKAKKIIAFVLVLVFAFSLMAMNASAVTPRGIACGDCGSSNTKTTTVYTGVTKQETVSSCSSYHGYHVHVLREKAYKFTCYNAACQQTYMYNYFWVTECKA